VLRIVETADVLEVQAPKPQSRRGLFLVLSLAPLLAPYELIVRPNWDNYSNPHFLFAALVSGGAVAMSAFFAWAALAGLSSRMRFDRVGRTFSYSASAQLFQSEDMSIQSCQLMRWQSKPTIGAMARRPTPSKW
jgi:hypothetical protein